MGAPVETLLEPGDPLPVEVVSARSRTRVVLACEHAGRAVPARLGDLGIAAAEMERHIAWDIGAEGLARRLAAQLGAGLVLQRYSRLVIDCNRPYAAPDLAPPVCDGTILPANLELDEAGRRARWAAIHQPFHDALAAALDGTADPILVAVHSFTPRLAGRERPWHAGLLCNRDPSFASVLLAALRTVAPGRPLALNEPYTVDDLSDYTIPTHGERRGIPHVLIEVRNDLITEQAGQKEWARLLARALIATVEDLPAWTSTRS